MKDSSLVTCPNCKQDKLYRVIGSGGGMIFKGSGFYKTDYPKDASRAKHSSDKSESSPKKENAPEKKSETKPDSSSSKSSTEKK
jgi:predicted nucleic acid-binding Zn ribbon protein